MRAKQLQNEGFLARIRESGGRVQLGSRSGFISGESLPTIARQNVRQRIAADYQKTTASTGQRP
jgi:hypothetical protein